MAEMMLFCFSPSLVHTQRKQAVLTSLSATPLNLVICGALRQRVLRQGQLAVTALLKRRNCSGCFCDVPLCSRGCKRLCAHDERRRSEEVSLTFGKADTCEPASVNPEKEAVTSELVFDLQASDTMKNMLMLHDFKLSLLCVRCMECTFRALPRSVPSTRPAPRHEKGWSCGSGAGVAENKITQSKNNNGSNK